MDSKEQPKDIKNSKFDNDKNINDYQLLILKLKYIKENINLLEKRLFSKKDTNVEK